MAFLEIEDLKVEFGGGKRPLRAVDGVGLSLERGEVLGIVGESGCGKTTLGNAVIGLVPIVSGRVRLDGVDTAMLSGRKLKAFRRRVQMIFQDPFGSLNARMTVGSCLEEVLKVHERDGEGRGMSRKQRVAARRARVRELLSLVGLSHDYANRYPHEFSGGQRQRIGIARALAVDPQLIIADEPVSALDVSVQVQILNLMKELQQRMDLAYIFIAHDLAVVRYMSGRILVMYLGRIVESADAASLFSRPAHPYTEALLSAVPDVDKGLNAREGGRDRIILKGDVPSATQRIPGCPFHPRCHRAEAVCREKLPPRTEVSPGHHSDCHFAGRLFGA